MKIALTVLALGATLAIAAATYDPRDPVRDARAIFGEALVAAEVGDDELALALMRDAWAADYTWLVPVLEIARRADAAGVSDAMMRSLDSIPLARGDSALARCVHHLVRRIYDIPLLERAMHAGSPASRTCAAASLETIAVPSARLLHQRFPESPWLANEGAYEMALEEPERAWRQVQKELRETDPVGRARSLGYGAIALHKLRLHDRAAAFEHALEARARRLGPGAMNAFMRVMQNHGYYIRDLEPDSALARHQIEVSAKFESLVREMEPRLSRRIRGGAALSRAIGLQTIGQLNESRDMLRGVILLSDSMGSKTLEAMARARDGRSLVKLGRHAEAEPQLRRALAIAAEVEDVATLREASHDLLHLYEGLGDYEAAVRAGEDFARYAPLTGAHATVMMAHHDLGWLHRRHGKLAAAESSFQRMLATAPERDVHFWAGEYLEYTGRLEAAVSHYEKASHHGQDRGRALAGLVRINEALGDLAEATRYAEIADRDTAAWHPEYAPLVPGLLARHGDRRAARAQYRLARETIARRGQMHSYAQMALESAENERALGEHGAARRLADSATAAAAAVGARELETRAQGIAALAAMAERPERAGAALAALDAAVRRADAMHVAQLSATMHTYRGEALGMIGRHADALRELARALAWADSTALRIAADPSRAAYRATHLGITGRALRLILRDSTRPDRAHSFTLWSARRKGGDVQTAALAPVGPSRAIVEYVVLDSTVAAAVTTARRTAIRVLAVSPDTLRAWITRFRAPIAPRVGSSIDRANIGFDDAVAERLYGALVDPLVADLGGRTELTIIPDGPLHTLPFDALVSSRAPRRYMIDDYTIAYAAPRGGAARAGSRKRADHEGIVLAIGGPEQRAAGAANEIRAMASVLGGRLSALPHASIGAARKRAEGGDVRVIHFATHAEANDASPDHARLALSVDSTGAAGWLHAFEIRDWKLDGALVVLSACETAEGRLAGGEGTLSLSRAFMRGGASGTVATLWPVGAPTATLMASFYRELASGRTTAAALRAARLELRRAGFDHPFYWAPFVFTTSDLSHSG